MYEWLRVARLSTVIDCWTIDWVGKYYLGFQLADFKAKPVDVTLPDYCVYTKYPFGWLVDDGVVLPLANAMWYKEWNLLDFFLEHIGWLVKLNIENNLYQWKQYPIIMNEWHEVYEWDLDIDWGTELKSFKVTDEMTKEQVDWLWFDNKFLKKSDEYKQLLQKNVSDDEVEDLF